MKTLFSNDSLAVSVCLRYSSLSSSWGPPYCETSPAFIMLISGCEVDSDHLPSCRLSKQFEMIHNKHNENYTGTYDKRKVHSVIQPPFLAKYSIGIQKYAGGGKVISPVSDVSGSCIFVFLWLSDAELNPQVTKWKPLSCLCHETHSWKNSFCTDLAP